MKLRWGEKRNSDLGWWALFIILVVMAVCIAVYDTSPGPESISQNDDITIYYHQ